MSLNFSGERSFVFLASYTIILVESEVELQTMINSLYKYCNNWSLNINLNKSKVVVFRQHSRISASVEWYYGTDKIEIVNEYKDLGINLTYNLSFKKHLQTKLESAINANWLNYTYNPKMKLSKKFKIFDAAAKSIMFKVLKFGTLNVMKLLKSYADFL